MPRPRTFAGLPGFGLMWAGQLVSLLGSGLVRFALGVFVFERTGSASQFALMAVFGALPGLLVAPFAGVLVDRWNRRTTMLLADAVAGFGTLGAALLLRADSLEVWHIYVMVLLSSVAESFQWPAYVATTTLLVPKKHFGRLGGLMQMGQAATGVLAPGLAGMLMGFMHISGLLFLDVAAFVIAAATLFLVDVPRPAASAEGTKAAGSMRAEMAVGWRFIAARPGLLGLLAYFAMINLILGLTGVLQTPMVLSIPATRQELGVVWSIANAGFLLGGLSMTVTGGPKRRIHGVLAFGLLFGVVLVVAALRPWVWLIAAAAFVRMFGAPIINGSSQAIWQAKVPADLQGRVFAVRRIVAQITAPLGFALAGPLADHVFEPLMAHGGPLAGSAGRLIGTGPGRGIALFYVTLALAPILASAWGYANPRITRLEDELPDAVGDRPPAAAPPAEAAPEARPPAPAAAYERPLAERSRS